MSDSIPLSLSQVITSSLFACKPNKSHLYNHPPLSLASDRSTMNDLQAGLLHTCTSVWLHKIWQTNTKLFQQDSYSVRRDHSFLKEINFCWNNPPTCSPYGCAPKSISIFLSNEKQEEKKNEKCYIHNIF